MSDFLKTFGPLIAAVLVAIAQFLSGGKPPVIVVAPPAAQVSTK